MSVRNTEISKEKEGEYFRQGKCNRNRDMNDGKIFRDLFNQ